MESISESGPSVSLSGLTSKQQSLLAELNSCVLKAGIEVKINDNSMPIGAWEKQTVALDVEHDESGGFVGCGIFTGHGNTVYYWSDRDRLADLPFSSFTIVAHNGVSDLECLRTWGIDVKDEQLVWDVYLIGHIMDSSLKSYGLKDMAKREIGISYPSYDDIVGKRGLKAERITLDKQPLELVARYNAMDCFVTYKLYEQQRNALNIETV